MENQKDNYIKDVGIAKGHAKDALETMDKSLLQSAKRAGNITTALYIVSNILPADEPLQKEIRKAGLTLLSVANDIAGARGENYDRRSNEINNIIKKIIAYLEVGVTLFLVSEMNFRILRLELMALGGSYESRRGGLVDLESILKTEPVQKTETPLRTVHNDKGHIKDIEDKGHEQMVINVLNRPIAPTFGSKNLIKDKSTTFDDRKGKIIKALIGNEARTIADIKAEFPNVSFKTIQRDLQSLIDSGKIERVGERRWSMYKIK